MRQPVVRQPVVGRPAVGQRAVSRSAAAALGAAYSGITAVVAGLDDAELLLPSGCRGWSIADLMLHLTLDAQRALVTLASPADGAPDVDAVSYWQAQDGPDDPDAALAHGQWVRRSAAAFTRPSGVVQRWRETAPAAVRAATAHPGGCVTTQGHVLTVPDFLATLVTEAVIHHLDLIDQLPDADDPAPQAAAIALSTLDGLAAPTGLPPQWSDREALLKGSGRRPLTAADHEALNDRAAMYPLLG